MLAQERGTMMKITKKFSVLVFVVVMRVFTVQGMELVNEAIEREKAGNYELHRACKEGNKVLVEQLLGEGVRVRAEDDDGMTALHWAAKEGHSEIVETLILNRADVRAKTQYGWTALHWAACKGHTEVFRLLFDNYRGYFRLYSKVFNMTTEMLLHLAVKNDRIEIVAILIQEGIRLDARDYRGRTALHWASKKGYGKIVSHLLAQKPGISPGWRDWIGSLWQNYKMPLIAFQDCLGYTALHWAAEKWHLEVMEHLLENGGNTETWDGFGRTVLHVGAQCGSEKVVELLLDRGANKEARTKRETGPQLLGNETALHIAAERGQNEVVELLLARGVYVNAKNAWDSTALHLAAKSGYNLVMERLLEKGADINARDRGHRSALHVAARGGHKDVVELLLSKGANPYARNNGRDRQFDFAKDQEVLQLLHDKDRQLRSEDRLKFLWFVLKSGWWITDKD